MKNRPSSHGESLSFLRGGGEMGRRMREMNWEDSPLGPPQDWEQSLKTAVRIVLTCRQPMFVWWTDQFFNLYNDAYAPILGKKHPDALARPAAEIWEEIWDEVGPRAESALLNNEGTFDEDLLLIMNRHGYPEETYYTFSYSPAPNDEGGTGGMICACTEETRRKIGGRRLDLLRTLAMAGTEADTVSATCERSCQALLHNSHDLPFAAIYLCSEDQSGFDLAGSAGIEAGPSAMPRFIKWNDLAWPFAKAIEENREIILGSLEERFEVVPTGAWDEPPSQAAIVPIVSTSREKPRGVFVSGLNPYCLYDDDYAGFLNLVGGQIASEIARAEAFEAEKHRSEALAELDRAKTIFFSNVSHEFRTPLMLIMGPLAELLEESNEGDSLEGYREILESANRNAERLLKLVNTLLDFSRIEAGRTEAIFEELDLAVLTRELASSFESAMSQAGLDFSIDCPALAEAVFVDRDMWEKIVLNLVSNAFKYTLEGSVSVSLATDKDRHAVLRVEDTGTGIAKEELPHLFDRFHRIEGSAGRSEEGSGIGLALVRELVLLHKGEVSVTSEPGKGSVFTVKIPLGSDHLDADQLARNQRERVSTASGASAYVGEALRWLPNASVTEADLSRNDSDDTGKPRLLLADDNADMRQYIDRLLSQHYTITAVAEGAEALRQARKHRPDLIISDVMMPKLNGIELIRELRADPVTAGIPVILLSARKGEEARIEGLNAGADDYITKPFSARELIARVSGALNLANLRQESTAREEELKAQTSHVLESITEGFISMDSKFNYTAMNDRAEKQLGMKREDLIGANLFELFPDLKGSEVEKSYRKAMEENVPVHFETFYESWQRWFEVSAYPARPEGLDIYFRDVTQRARSETILDGQKRALERAVHGAPLPHVLDMLARIVEELSGNTALASILLLDDEGRRLLHGAAPSLPQAYNDAIHGIEIGPKVGSCGSAAFNGEPVVVEDIASDPLWADFKDLALEHHLRACWSTPILSAQGEVLGTFAVYHRTPSRPSHEDRVTVDLLKNTAALVIERDRERQRRQAIAESLKEADRRKDEFLATLAHELRNPLAPIRTGLEVLRISKGDQEKAEQIQGIMERQTEQMVRLIDDLLDISRITRGKFKLQTSRINLRQVVQNSVEAVRPLIREAGHDLKIEQPPEDLEIEGDPHRLAQVLSNLLQNAAKYTPNGGRIELRTIHTPDEKTIRFEVEDNGEGIAPDLRECVFEMFTQVGADSEKKGLGIGLTLVKSLVEMHGGTVGVESGGHGKGSLFTVNLPLSTASFSRPEAPSTEDAPRENTESENNDSGPRVLIVDDKKTAVETLAMFFELQGFEVETAYDGVEAVEAAREFQPSIVLMDIGMPKMDGNEAARKIRQMPGGDDMFLIALTGWGQDKDREKTKAAGFDRHFVKPVEPAVLRDFISEWKKSAN